MSNRRKLVTESAIVTILLFIGACTGSNTGTGTNDNGSNGDSNMNDEPGARPEPGDVSGLLGANEAWSIAANNLLVLGFGNMIEGVLVVDDDGSFLCVGSDPLARVNYEGETLQFTGDFHSTSTDEDCTIELSATASHCAAGSLGATPSAMCTLDEGSGSASVGDTRFEWTEQTLVRFESCPTVPTTIQAS